MDRQLKKAKRTTVVYTTAVLPGLRQVAGVRQQITVATGPWAELIP